METPCSYWRSNATYLRNLTFTTEYDRGHTLHIDQSQLLVDLQNNTCGIAFSVVVDSNEFKSQNDTLILGKSFLALYNVSLDFSHQRIGFEGFVSDPFVFPQQFVTKEPL